MLVIHWQLKQLEKLYKPPGYKGLLEHWTKNVVFLTSVTKNIVIWNQMLMLSCLGKIGKITNF
jgi:hypothetical protein